VGKAMVDLRSKIFIAGHRGLVGSALLRRAEKLGYKNLIMKTRQELDLTDQKAVAAFFSEQKPEYVFMAAAKVGGIWANATYPAEFIYENITIQTNLIHQSYRHGIKKLLFLGSSCIYPKNAPQPMKEEHLLTGTLEPTNEPYAIAKIAGIKMCQAYNRQYGTNFISVMPTNLYGPGDNYDLETSHVIAALIRKFHEAKVRNDLKVVVWGTGTPKREFLFIDDLADACFFLMQNYNESEIINIGYGKDITINSLAGLIKQVVGYNGNIVYDETKPDGVSQKILDTTKLSTLGWNPQHDLKEGLKKTYASFKSL
jgi:GDP-L-fucose synthase